MLQREESRHDFAFLAGVLVGALAGAAATLALTPLSGSETRDKLRAQTSNLNVNVGDLKQRAGDLAGAAGARVAPLKERVTELASKSPRPLGRTTEPPAAMDATRQAHAAEGAQGAHAGLDRPLSGLDETRS